MLFIVYYISGFLLGYASNGNHVLASWLLFAAFVLFHIILNVIINYKKFKSAQILMSCVYVLMLYGCIVYYFAG